MCCMPSHIQRLLLIQASKDLPERSQWSNKLYLNELQAVHILLEDEPETSSWTGLWGRIDDQQELNKCLVLLPSKDQMLV
jgi:hypothetical protein